MIFVLLYHHSLCLIEIKLRGKILKPIFLDKLESKFSYLLQYKSILICLDDSAECTEEKLLGRLQPQKRDHPRGRDGMREVLHSRRMRNLLGESLGVSQFPPPFSLPLPRDLIYLSNIC